MRPTPVINDPSAMIGEQAKFEYLINENYKYMNFARYSLIQGERVILSIYQPQKNHRLVNVLGRNFIRPKSLAHLTILTDREVILIGDAEGISEKKRNKYGGVHCFIPLRSLTSVSLEEEPGGLLRFTFHVFPDEKISKFFDASHLLEIENLKKSIEAVIVK
jgi:hypothetical protein